MCSTHSETPSSYISNIPVPNPPLPFGAPGQFPAFEDVPVAPGFVVVNQTFYIFGGMMVNYPDPYQPVFDSTRATTLALSAAGTFTAKADMNTPRAVMATAKWGGMIYAIGGLNTVVDSPAGTGSFFVANTLASCEVYNPAADTWTSIAPMPTARGYATTTVALGVIYVVNGLRGEDAFSFIVALEAYTIATNMWTVLAPLPSSGTKFSSLVTVVSGPSHNPNAVRLVLAGVDVSDNWFVSQYTPHHNVWESLNSTWAPVAPWAPPGYTLWSSSIWPNNTMNFASTAVIGTDMYVIFQTIGFLHDLASIVQRFDCLSLNGTTLGEVPYLGILGSATSFP